LGRRPIRPTSLAAAELVARGVAVLAAVGGDASVAAAKQATSVIPIVFGIGGGWSGQKPQSSRRQRDRLYPTDERPGAETRRTAARARTEHSADQCAVGPSWGGGVGTPGDRGCHAQVWPAPFRRKGRQRRRAGRRSEIADPGAGRSGFGRRRRLLRHRRDQIIAFAAEHKLPRSISFANMQSPAA